MFHISGLHSLFCCSTKTHLCNVLLTVSAKKAVYITYLITPPQPLQQEQTSNHQTINFDNFVKHNHLA